MHTQLVFPSQMEPVGSDLLNDKRLHVIKIFPFRGGNALTEGVTYNGGFPVGNLIKSVMVSGIVARQARFQWNRENLFSYLFMLKHLMS